MARVPLYDALAVDYDRFVNWEARLANELPFLERLFETHGVRRVLDSACGTGHHAIALARRGYALAGADLSGAMVEQACRNAAAAGTGIRFFQAGLGQLAEIAATAGSFDAAICLGNSLPHLLTEDAVADSLADFAAVLRPGGLLVIQNRNFDRVWTKRERFMGPQSVREGDREWLFVRFYDFHQETVTFNMVRLVREGNAGPWNQDVQSTELRLVFRDPLAAQLTQAGFHPVEFYGDYRGSAFDREQSDDLIVVGILS